MQNNVIIKLGMAALLSVMMAACSSTDTEGTTDTGANTGNNATSAPATTSNTLTAEQQRERDALAMTVFFFEFDKSDLSQEARDALVYHANALKANPSSRVRLEGHADERGTREYNLALGERRAQAVERYLQVNGVAATQIETVSYGEERPAQNGTTEAAYSANRRVELVK